MNKEEFLKELRSHLKGLSQEDINERISFYSEMIDDRVDEGKTEAQAIEELGGVDKVIDDILKDTPLLKLVKERTKPKRALRAWEIIFLILGFPLWFPLFLVFVILCLVGYLLVWVWVLVSYAIEAAFMAGSVWGFVGFVTFLANGTFSMTYLGAGILGLGLSFLFIFACIGTTKATILLSKATGRRIKRWLVGKGE